jgi:cytoskeletal protein RodZ
MMQTIGNCLKSGREARNIGLSEVARSTKISKWYLDCLEKDEFDKIPGGPYIKGYIASYASFIGIEEDEILKQYDSLQINSADENEIQAHLPQDKKRQKLIGFFISKKNLLILSMAVLILLALGFNYFFFQNRTHIAAQSQDVQDSKLQSADPSKIKQEAAGVSQITDLSKNNQLNPIKTEDESRPAHQDAAETESLALLPSEQNFEGKPKAVLSEKNENHPQKATAKEPVFNDAPSSLEKNNSNRTPLTNSKKALHQDTSRSSDLQLESAPGYQLSDTRPPPANNMQVIRAVAASGLMNKNPAGPSDSFPWSMEKVYIWTMIECDRPPSSIRHTYYFKGQKVNDIVLKIKSPRWRTWSYKTLLDKRFIGQWKVDITSDEGELLQSVFFEVN